VSLVGLTTQRNGNNRYVAFTRKSDEVAKEISCFIRDAEKIDTSHMEDAIISGVLYYADERKNDIKLDSVDGQKYNVRVPKGLMADIVKPYWGDEVTIKGKKQGKVILFESLKSE
jgi:hypothetical protein